MTLPSFKYHPDPIATGSIEERSITCLSCGKPRTFVYVGPVYAKADLDNAICPWCISSGLAHEKFGVEFTDIEAVGDYVPTASISDDVKREVAYQTPGFNGWQQERWLVHCGDACAFLGPAGKGELEAFASEELIDSIRADAEMTDAEFSDYLEKMDKQNGPTAYVFRCLNCGSYQGYSDF